MHQHSNHMHNLHYSMHAQQLSPSEVLDNTIGNKSYCYLVIVFLIQSSISSAAEREIAVSNRPLSLGPSFESVIELSFLFLI